MTGTTLGRAWCNAGEVSPGACRGEAGEVKLTKLLCQPERQPGGLVEPCYKQETSAECYTYGSGSGESPSCRDEFRTSMIRSPPCPVLRATHASRPGSCRLTSQAGRAASRRPGSLSFSREQKSPAADANAPASSTVRLGASSSAFFCSHWRFGDAVGLCRRHIFSISRRPSRRRLDIRQRPSGRRL